MIFDGMGMVLGKQKIRTSILDCITGQKEAPTPHSELKLEKSCTITKSNCKQQLNFELFLNGCEPFFK